MEKKKDGRIYRSRKYARKKREEEKKVENLP